MVTILLSTTSIVAIKAIRVNATVLLVITVVCATVVLSHSLRSVRAALRILL